MAVGRPLFAFVTALAALLLATPPARAQADSSVSLGVGFSVTTPTNDAAGTDVGPGFVIRLRGGLGGFGPAIGMSWFTTPVHTDVGGEQVELGSISVRPLMFGAGYSRELSRRLNWNSSLAVGIAFGHARGTSALKEAFERLGVGQVGVKVANAFAWRVSTGLWIDLGPRIGMTISVGYLGVQPDITITTATGNMRRSIDLGSLVTSAGITYGIF
jgi:hypothetical protein